MSRPLAPVFSLEGKTTTQVAVPVVFDAPVRADLVQDVHTKLNKNRRQAYAVNHMAGMQHSAHSWGTGRAMARIPRVQGSGTSRAGQGAFGNMCRKGRLFAPTKTWRKWHVSVSVNQRRYAVVSALAASSSTALVMARGHKVDGVPSMPLVVADDLESVNSTKKAVAALKAINAYADVERVIASKGLRAGRGKMRNRRFVQRRGPLVVYKNNNGLVTAFRNVAGVDTSSVTDLNLLQLAPGGHIGRFIIFTESAFKALEGLYAAGAKKGFTLPRSLVSNTDVTRIIKSEEIQAVLRAKKTARVHQRKKNPFKNMGAMAKLNPYRIQQKREATKVCIAAHDGTLKKATKKCSKGSSKFFAAITAE